jgi:hypothetical protein
MINQEELKKHCDSVFEKMREQYREMTSGDFQTVAIFIKMLDEEIAESQKEDSYKSAGYKDRNDYLSCMADDYGVNEDVVIALASTLGPGEDFDGLISALDDMEDGLY